MEKSMPLKERHPWLILGGLITTLLSLAVFHAGQLFSFDSANFDLDRFFLGNYTIAVVWMLVASFHNVSVSGWRRLFQLEPPLYRIAITLFTISAFSLNRSLNVLGETPIWVGVYLYITYVALFVDIYADQLPQAINRAINFLAGMGTLMVFYFLLLTIPALPFSLVGGIYFGISWHMFAPLFAFLGFLGVLRKRKASDMRISFLVGLAVPIFVLIAYTIQVQQVSADLERVSASYHSSNSPLPEPVFAGQYLQDRLFSAHIMRENTPNGQFRDVFNMGSVNDPLAIIAQEFSKSLSMSKSNRAKVLAARTNLKHESQRRLWSGGNLLTRHVATEVDIYSEYRLAYVEKTIEVEHYGVSGTFNSQNQQEAVYTFHLPAGSVATSLSLWVDGVERKSRFTTKAKADRAYSRIVGVEQRDPALLHWQEGNNLVVTIFPVRPDLPRKFKLGITVPLRLVRNELVLENVYFEGPTSKFASEKTEINFVGEVVPKHIGHTAHFEHQGGQHWEYEGTYRPYWELSCSANKVSTLPFIFNHKSYHAYAYEPQLEKRDFQTVYLDLNQAWDVVEFEKVWGLVRDKEVYTFNKRMIRLNNQNRKRIFREAQEMQYSLFPFFEIKDVEHALVISKTVDNYVELSDVRESEFGRRLLLYLETATRPVSFYNLGTELSPYLKSLREFQALNYATGEFEQLRSWLSQATFPVKQSDLGRVVLPGPNLVIEQSDYEGDSPASQVAPDHLMRLFAYNKTLERAGVCFLTQETYADEIVKSAAEAFVVTPFTSLIVLETDFDYKRFGIDSLNNSLGNAFNSSNMAANSTGSVPEPHEWLLIILVMLFLVWTQRQRLQMLRFR